MVSPSPKYGAFDRMEIECAGPDVGAMAKELHRQLGSLHGSIDVEAIAHELDIVEIRLEPLDNIEGALLTTPEKDVGAILVNQHSNRRRRRFTIAHELCHLLHAHHRPQRSQGFLCSRKDIRVGRYRLKPGLPPHERQEWQANRFAIELLVPEHRLTQHLEEAPSLDVVLEIAGEFDISREAAARHFIQKSEVPMAMVFSQHGRFRYASRGDGFSPLGLSRGDPLVAHVGEVGEMGELETVDPADWLHRPDSVVLASQTLAQQEGYAMTLLIQEEPDEPPSLPAFRRSRRKP